MAKNNKDNSNTVSVSSHARNSLIILKFLPSLKPNVNTAKASVKKTLSRDDTKKGIQSAPSAVTGIRQLDIKYAITLT